ncbi:pseudouridine synthase [Paenibacillus donghaensis]|uniref:Pseudouridine synthase n=1 Tax=Paenibacillus donghaensis TaxID=414771 RepID=A0A2Z2KDI2_9BACL|nr:pseudouridine synthase [Paenibacillus donghaensis]ASA21130.1 23S rRNA pseudouridine synthase F [Paenibacillus donghaensis]
MRINKYMSLTGVCSRREADRMIAAGRITINGNVCAEGGEVIEGDEVRFDGKLLSLSTAKPVYLMLNKPLGITCTSARQVEGNIIDYVNYPSRIFAVGRLDKFSEGLILLTNDGAIVNSMMRSENGHEKEYRVVVDHAVTEAFLQEMAGGVEILGVTTEPCRLYRVAEREFGVILTQGLNLQIRRMCKALGYRVLSLERIRIMNLTLDGLERGEWREMDEAELQQLFFLLK